MIQLDIYNWTMGWLQLQRKSSREKVWLRAWTQDEDGQSLAGDEEIYSSGGKKKDQR